MVVYNVHWCWSVHGTEEETENSANCLWLVTNSKPCPNCKSPIQKNEGCNHMKCSKVHFASFLLTSVGLAFVLSDLLNLVDIFLLSWNCSVFCLSKKICCLQHAVNNGLDLTLLEVFILGHSGPPRTGTPTTKLLKLLNKYLLMVTKTIWFDLKFRIMAQ